MTSRSNAPPVFRWVFGAPIPPAQQASLVLGFRNLALACFGGGWPDVLGLAPHEERPVPYFEALADAAMAEPIGTPVGDLLGECAILITNVVGEGGFWTGIEEHDGSVVPVRLREEVDRGPSD